MARLRLTLLGGFEARLASGAPLSLPSRKSRALLAYLAVRPARGASRDAVAALLWGEAGEAQARQSLRQALAALRRALPRVRPALLAADHQGIALGAAALEVDVLRFERAAGGRGPAALEQAVTLYRGDLLDGFRLGEARFEEWLRGERERLRGVAVAALERLSEHRLPAGGVEAGVQAGLRLLALDPSQEPVHRALMRLYVRSGQRAAAVRQYRRCVDVLRRELGVAPEAATEAVLREAASHRVPTLPAPPAVGARAAREGRLVGRQAELGQLCSLFDEACRGRGRFVTVSGEAGIGKSRLLRELASWAARAGAPVVEARCFEGEHVLPFAPWVNALRHPLMRPTLDEVAAADERSRRELSRLLPELGRSGAEPLPEGEYLRIFEVVTRVVTTAAVGQPLLLILEDLHWADDMSVRLLAFLVRRAGAARLFVAASMRDEELLDRAAARRLLDDAAEMAPLRLGPLSAPATVELVKSLAPAGLAEDARARLAKRVWRLSEGNPFVVLETMKAVPASRQLDAMDRLPLAARIRQLIVRRLDRLGPRSRRLVAVAAVIGRDFEVGLLRRAAGVSDRVLADEMEELARHRILHAAGDGFAFTHDYIREVAYAELLAPRRRLLHAAVARGLETHYAERLEPHWAALGGHHREAGDWAAAAGSLRQAAAIAARRGAYQDAAAFLDQAVTAVERLPRGRATLEQGIDLRFELASVLGPLGEFDRIEACVADAERMAAALGDRHRLAWAGAHLGGILWQTGRPAEACEAAARARAAGERLGDRGLVMNATFCLGVTHALCGRYAPAEAYLEEILAEVDLGGERYGLEMFPAAACRSWLAYVYLERGEFDRGLPRAREALRVAEAHDHSYSIGIASWVLGMLYVNRGCHEDAVPVLERALALAHDSRIAILVPIVKALLRRAYAVTGRSTAAGPPVVENLAFCRTGTIYHASARLVEGGTHMAVGRLTEAVAAAEDAIASARLGRLRPAEASALRLLGSAQARREPGDVEGAEVRYREALSLAEDLGARLLAAHCHLDLGKLYRHAGKPELAAPSLLAARAMFVEMGMPRALAQVEDELRQARTAEPEA